MALTSKSMSYDSEWCHSDSRKISHDLLRLQWQVQDENNVSSLDQGWPNTLDESVSVKKILLLYAFQKSSPFFFPRQIFIYWPWIFFFSKHNFLVFIFSACAAVFFYAALYYFDFSIYFNATFSSFLPLFSPCSLDALFLHSLLSLSSLSDHGITSSPRHISKVP